MTRTATCCEVPSPKFSVKRLSTIPPIGVPGGMWPWLSVQSTWPLMTTVFGLPATGSHDMVP